jgi:hypothetical protein
MSTFLLDLDQVGDTNSKLFHLQVSAQCRKNHIPSLHHADRVCTTHQAIAELLKGFYTEHWGSQASRALGLAGIKGVHSKLAGLASHRPRKRHHRG